MVKARTVLSYIDKFLIKQAPKCNPVEHFHPGIVECHPKPPLPGSWHKDPKIRHTKEQTVNEQTGEITSNELDELYSNPSHLKQMLKFLSSLGLLGDSSQIREIIRDLEQNGPDNIDLSYEDKQLIESLYSKSQEILEQIHSTLSQPIDNIIPFNVAMENRSGHAEYFGSILDQYSVREKDSGTKQRITKELADKLRGNAHFEALAQHIKENYLKGVSVSSQLPSWIDQPEWSFPGKDDVESCIAELIHTWAVSSADHNKLAIMLQWAVANEFRLEEFYESSISDFSGGASSLKHEQGYRVFVRAVYDHTQEWFKKYNIDSVILHRGMALQPEDMTNPDWHIKDSGETSVSLQPMSSFSTDDRVAYDFSGMRAKDDEEIPIILSARVPVNKIIATAQTGWGCKSEAEMIVLGGTHKMAYHQPAEEED